MLIRRKIWLMLCWKISLFLNGKTMAGLNWIIPMLMLSSILHTAYIANEWQTPHRSHSNCSGSLEPEYSCHDRDWIMELPMEADILTFTGILTPEDASVASCCSGSAGASVVAHGVALPLYRDCFLDLRLFNSPDLRRLVLCYCCQAWTFETVLGGNTALPRWWTARSIDADAKR